ncbi:sugar ABC transporter ATP-binding protein [Leucobacter weissii]|uniref:Sugar ABC transporter ATP-binding protein n=1 Tax=Leucobacter weissii TaxID=1983706 RepID=A0A939SBK2_9MICO|nr:sugar ABC transporter ATP-binding protein [Leucobacter weissii]MBO1901525.1 sugar ABC transporter ATP-binding protein [Leucobacter weissii]
MSEHSDDIAIAIEGVTKQYGPTTALDGVSLRIRRGRSCALLGRNGAGKSTLIAALTGLVRADSGTISVRGDADGEIEGPGGHSIACVYQKSTLVSELTVAENIWLGRYPRNRLGLVDWHRMRADSLAYLEEWGIGHTVDLPVEALEPIEAKIVEVCRALSRGPRILLLDEPTAGLDEAGCRELFEKIRLARSRGVTIIYVSHYLEEVFQVCDEAVILRDGRVVLEADTADLTVETIVDAMVGEVDGRPGHAARDLPEEVPESRPVVLDIDGAVIGEVSASTRVRRGEILGFTGLDGAGHVRIAEAIVGAQALDSGRISVGGTRVPRGVDGAIRAGIGFVPEDRHRSGFVPDLSVEENSTLSALRLLRNRAGLIDERRRRTKYEELAGEWEIKASSPEQRTAELSGGNQQKVVMARALATDPDILVLINPTAGVDVHARSSIYTTIQELALAGRTVVIASSDGVDFTIAHRVIVMFRGRPHAELAAGFSEKQLAAAVQGE